MRPSRFVLALGVALVGLLATGCASVPPKGGFADVEEIVAERLGKDVHWYQGGPEDKAVAERVAELLAGELSLEAAVQIALLNSRSLQALYEDLGIAQADLVQAGLLRNPVFFASARGADEGSLSTNTELEVVQDFLDILLRPARRRLASLELEAAKLRVAQAVIAHAGDVERAYVTMQGGQQIAEMLAVIAKAGEAAYGLAQRQYTAGNLNELDLVSQQGLYEEARIELARGEAEVLLDRETLNRLLGLWGDDTAWSIPGALRPVPEVEVPLAEAESLAIAHRLDLAAARLETEQLAEALRLTVKWRWFAVADVGVSTEKEADGLRVTGPSLQIELPIFDQGQAKIARLEALNRQSQQRMMDLAIDIRAEVREARQRVLAQRRLAEHYEKVLIPVRERIVEQAQRHYNYMFLGAYRLLEAKQDEVAAYREYIEAVRDYWHARIDLELAVGGVAAVADEIPAEISAEPTDPASGPHDHH